MIMIHSDPPILLIRAEVMSILNGVFNILTRIKDFDN
jgi:hypothetical protein